MNLNDFQNLLLNRDELEKALGKKIDTPQENRKSYLDDYSLYHELKLCDVVCIFIGEDPRDETVRYTNQRYYVVYDAIKNLAEAGKIEARTGKDKHGFANVFLSHDVARKYAETNNLNWDVPPYREITLTEKKNNLLQNTTDEADTSHQRIAELEQQLLQEQSNNADEVARLNAIIQQQAETIAQLEENLKQLEVQTVRNGGNATTNKDERVNYDDFSIWGHSSELLTILSRVIKEFWANAETPPKNAQIEAWIEQEYPLKTYPYVSKAVRQYIATIARPQPKLK